MAGEIVSVATGAMRPLLSKLTTLMGDEYEKLTGVRKQASFLKDELSAMEPLFDKLELMDVLDPLAKYWRDHVREMCCHMENCIDDLMRNLGGADAKAGFMRKTAQLLKRVRARHQIAYRIEELKALAVEANEWRMSYRIKDYIDAWMAQQVETKIEMAGEITSASTGAMNPLLGKLAALMGDEYKKLKGVRKQVSFLMRELPAMRAALQMLDLLDELDPQAKNWRDHVREMSYDMENCIDDFMRQFGGANNAKSGFVRKTAQRLKRLWKRHQIADQIEELKVLALEASERRTRYNIDDRINSSSVRVAVDPRVSAIYQEAAGLVGIDGPRKDLVSWLTATEEKLKVVSIVGFGGLGKTTLAKQVYDEIGGQFDCKAFVSVSQRLDMTSFFTDLQLKLGMKEEECSCALDVQNIIDRLREHLSHKRYLIVVDDLWDESAWKIISCAFAKGGNGSKVIVTTRVDNVALWACHDDRECIYRMKPLKEQDSRRLFFNRVFGSEDGCPPQLKAVSAEILKKCGGLPLAIITIASLLASHQARSMNEWERVRNSLGAKFASKPTLEEMRSILNLSYIHLPLHLRACLLYLGMYPEDREILRDDLVQQWIVEGFVSHLHGSDLEDAAKSYFNELINRSLIQPERTEYGEVLSCRVHNMMLDLILTKCAEDNFISVVYNCEDIARRRHKVRRLSLNPSAGSTTSEILGMHLSQVRSFAYFGDWTCIPTLWVFKLVRVLVVEIPWTANRDETVDLTDISQLLELRYLKVSTPQRIKLPAEIGGLVHLETLELDCGYQLGTLPDMVHLPCLSRLVLPKYCTALPEGIVNMKSLRTLHGFDVGKKPVKDIMVLGELTNLRDLRISNHTMGPWATTAVDALASSIVKLRNLKCLRIDGWNEAKDDKLSSLSGPPPLVEVLELGNCLITRVPKWIGSLNHLRDLGLRVWEISTEEVHLLGKLRSLVGLRLWAVRFTEDMAITVSKELFPVLEHLELRSREDVTAYLSFEAGAMPILRELTLRFDGQNWGGATPFGMEHLLRLEQIRLHKFPGQELPAAESAFRNATQLHPGRPSFTISGL